MRISFKELYTEKTEMHTPSPAFVGTLICDLKKLQDTGDLPETHILPVKVKQRRFSRLATVTAATCLLVFGVTYFAARSPSFDHDRDYAGDMGLIGGGGTLDSPHEDGKGQAWANSYDYESDENSAVNNHGEIRGESDEQEITNESGEVPATFFNDHYLRDETKETMISRYFSDYYLFLFRRAETTTTTTSNPFVQILHEIAEVLSGTTEDNR
ncbi:MAG: hypothetical protein FWG83_01570 [Oscillospiraceae bacterium]|nr:hypothetical protein [Oscillospiraceae bacterium]